MFWTRKKTDIDLSQTETNLIPTKTEIIDFGFTTFNLRSFADLGALWGVDGGYTFYTLNKYQVEYAVLVDTHPTEIFKERSKKYPQLRFIKGNFGDERIVH